MTEESLPLPITPSGRIIDRDIEFYQMEVEYCAEQRRRCLTNHEKYWDQRYRYACDLVNAMSAYRVALDCPRVG